MERPKYKSEEEERTFTIVNEDAVARLRKDGKIDLPPKKMNIPKDERWNMKTLYSATLHGIENGDSAKDIANAIFPEIMKKSKTKGVSEDQMKGIIKKNQDSAIRNARTMVTGAQNLGRLDSFLALQAQGVVQRKIWEATPDDRTRKSHIDIDGEEAELSEKFSNGCMYPGDGNGPPDEVWNCRCSMDTRIIGFTKASGEVVNLNRGYDRTLHDEQMEWEKAIRSDAKGTIEKIGFTSVSGLDKMDKRLLPQTVRQLSELEDKFGAIKSFKDGFEFTLKDRDDCVAVVSSYVSGTGHELQLSTYYYGDSKDLMSNARSDLRTGFTMPCDKAQQDVYTITHEYGHIIQHSTIYTPEYTEKFYSVVSSKEESAVYHETHYKQEAARQMREILAIAKKNNPNFDFMSCTSEYSRSNPEEFFAEAFANSQCGKPNEIGNAMLEWLRRSGFNV